MSRTHLDLPALETASPENDPWSGSWSDSCIELLIQERDNLHNFRKILDLISRKWGVQRAYNLLMRFEIMAGIRTVPDVAIFDHSLHLVGGGQKYGCTIAHVLQNLCRLTLISPRPVTLSQLEEWYGLDLGKCQLRIIPIPFFERPEYSQVDPGIITVRQENPFHLISRESGLYDLFINNSMLEMVYPLSNLSVFVCHFPERRRSRYFYVNSYDHLIFNSHYTADWIEKKWKLFPDLHIYPPADMEPAEDPLPEKKEQVILSVARFEPGGSKQQEKMVACFSRLYSLYPRLMQGWKLILAGGSPSANPYLTAIEQQLRSIPSLPVELRINTPADELRDLYRKASIFWHFCGLYQQDPGRVEHFGMTIVEAMQNGCVPVVFDGGGQREIVEEGVSGFRFSDRLALMQKTVHLLQTPSLRSEMSKKAREASFRFSRACFEERVRDFFQPLLEKYGRLH